MGVFHKIIEYDQKTFENQYWVIRSVVWLNKWPYSYSSLLTLIEKYSKVLEMIGMQIKEAFPDLKTF